ncbi:hypothetical protein MTR67_051665 [Solanum verrucosum]|uniref:Uncharacterized protein n=1 Tax=Solanum verrucosum TaxID=315347 RepID=A0AAF1A2M9_SOLVR|nr:hypothetical protein MTR67_051665 [Solanum verrucosum]
MCTWESRYNFVITTTFERSASARLFRWLKKVWDIDQRPDWMLPHTFDELRLYWNTDKFKAMSVQSKKARGNHKGGSLHTGGMTAPPSLEEGQYTTRSPRFNGQYYGCWKTRTYDYIMAEDNELWDVVLNGPYVPTKVVKERDLTRVVPKCSREYDEAD